MRHTYHDGKVLIVDAVVVDWRLEEVRVFLEPVACVRLLLIAARGQDMVFSYAPFGKVYR